MPQNAKVKQRRKEETRIVRVAMRKRAVTQTLFTIPGFERISQVPCAARHQPAVDCIEMPAKSTMPLPAQAAFLFRAFCLPMPRREVRAKNEMNWQPTSVTAISSASSKARCIGVPER
jgi:hypothetical protein